MWLPRRVVTDSVTAFGSRGRRSGRKSRLPPECPGFYGTTSVNSFDGGPADAPLSAKTRT